MIQYCQANLGSIDVSGPIGGEESAEEFTGKQDIEDNNGYLLPSDVSLQIPIVQMEGPTEDQEDFENQVTSTLTPNENQENNADPNMDSYIASPELQSQPIKLKKSQKHSKKNKKHKSRTENDI
jgi:hypothetical protein